MKSRNVVTSQETETAVSVSRDVTTFLDLTSFRHLRFAEMVLPRTNSSTINAPVKTQNRVKHRVWYTDPWPDPTQNRWPCDPVPALLRRANAIPMADDCPEVSDTATNYSSRDQLVRRGRQ